MQESARPKEASSKQTLVNENNPLMLLVSLCLGKLGPWTQAITLHVVPSVEELLF